MSFIRSRRGPGISMEYVNVFANLTTVHKFHKFLPENNVQRKPGNDLQG